MSAVAWPCGRRRGGSQPRLDEVNRANVATLDALTETTKAKKATDAALKQSEESRTRRRR